MPQNRDAGAAANSFGRETGRKIAEAIGVAMVSNNGNEANWNDSRVVIKCARRKTSGIGVSYKMLAGLDLVLAAFESADEGFFDVVSLPATTFKNSLRPTRSKGPSAGRVGIVSKAVFLKHGESIGRVKI